MKQLDLEQLRRIQEILGEGFTIAVSPHDLERWMDGGSLRLPRELEAVEALPEGFVQIYPQEEP